MSLVLAGHVYTGGTFDLFHAGHVNLLRECKKLGHVTVALNTDEFVQRFKRKRPVIRYDDRAAVLAACRYVDRVMRCDGDSVATVEAAKPDYIVVGSDWAKKDYYAQMGFSQEWLDERGINLVYVPYTNWISSTAIRELAAVR